MFLNVNSVLLVIVGVLLLIFAKRITYFMVRVWPDSKFSGSTSQKLLYTWPVRLIGFICLGFAFALAVSHFPQGGMKSDKNRLRLLESGEIARGEVIKVHYQRLAPSGWEVRYTFGAKDPATDKDRIYLGSAQGPKSCYANLSTGDAVHVVFDPAAPQVNCEIWCFLNKPSFRTTFRKARKLELLAKFGDEWEVRDYSFEEWYRQQQKR